MLHSTLAGRRERKRAEIRAHLARTAHRLFEAHGYEAVTMEQVAAEADVAKGTLYNHFPVKEALLAHWVHTELALDTARVLEQARRKSGLRARLIHVLNESADWSAQHRAWLPHYIRFRFVDFEKEQESGAVEESGDDAPRDLMHIFAALFEEARLAGEVRKELAAAPLAALLHDLYFGVLLRWLIFPGMNLRREFAAALDVLLQGALAAPASAKPAKPVKRNKP